ncbi:MAG: hypothetical protein KDD51_11595 [Bdellovibrionales bacterium]|nr:hypothetical protein [Bdellovibrionales bacterium]
MRALSVWVCAILISRSVLAWTSQAFTSMEVDVKRGALDIFDLNRSYGVSTLSEIVGYRTEGIASHFNAEVALTFSQPDYSSVLIRDKNQNEKLLSEMVSARNELSAAVGAEYQRGADSASLKWSGSLTQSPFAFQSFLASYRRSFFNRSTVVGVSGVYLLQHAPESYYLDSDFNTRNRPTRINGVEAQVTGEQSLSTRWKVAAELAASQRLEERPPNLRVVLRQAYAVSNRVFVSMQFDYASELRSVPLKDERGYFRNLGGQVGLTVEPWYDFLVTAAYGLLVEDEEDPRSGRWVQVAGDQYALGLRYRLARLEFRIEAAYVRTNTKVDAVRASGGVRWTL